MTLPRYPAYKDSGVEWLEQVPVEWQLERLKRVCNVFPSNVDKKMYDGDPLVSLCNYTDVYYNELIVEGMPLMAATATVEQVQKFTLQTDDTIITKDSETPDDIGISAYVPQTLPGVVCGYHLSMVRPMAGTSGRFIKRFFDSGFAKAQMQVAANGLTRVGLSQSALDNLFVPYPPLPEQTAIATFLDHETSKIDALIAEQKNLIALLKEKRQAVISHAVTKGLNPDVPMKDSGVEWLGEVPAHWEVGRISAMTHKITNGYVGPTRDILVDDGVRYLQSLHIKENRIRFDDRYFVTEEWSNQHAKSILQSGDVLVVQTGDIGQVSVVTPEFAGCNCHALIILTPVKSRLTGDWLASVLNSTFGFHSLLAIQTGALHPHLNCGNVKDLSIPIPPLGEQELITEEVKRVVAELEELSQEVQGALRLLVERRSALISAAVTGKIDVRGLASQEAA